MEKTIAINGVRVNYKTDGDGKAVLLLHGWGCDLHIFDRLHAYLSQWFRVFSLDFPGFGKSDEPSEVWGIEKYTQLLEAFVADLHIENPLLLGHSFGGRVAILFASRNKVNKTILVDSAGVKPKRSLKYYTKVYAYKSVKKIGALPGIKNLLHDYLESYKQKAGSADYRNASPRMKQILVKVVNEDLQDEMPKIKSPTLLIWGENDEATPVNHAKIMEKRIPDSGLAVLKACGHYSFLEKYAEFLLIIDNFLNNDKKTKNE
ncbi:MAG: alpha/beta hydrolase [Bacteroidia bacterium]|nr:MAG: alpha/beta hydrolase [Bacteroidia bacterium]